MRALFAVFCLLLVTGCDQQASNGPTGPTVPINQQFTLAPMAIAAIGATGMRVQFVDVTNDSRCPADAICITGGDAIVKIRVYDGTTHEYELHTGDTSRAAVMHRDMRIALLQLSPYPFASRPHQASDYRATLSVTQ